MQSIAEPQARAAYLWVLGEYGAQIQVGQGGGGRAFGCQRPQPLGRRARAASPVQPATRCACVCGLLARNTLLDMPPHQRQDAPYVLEAFADEFSDEEPPVKLVSGAGGAPGGTRNAARRAGHQGRRNGCKPRARPEAGSCANAGPAFSRGVACFLAVPLCAMPRQRGLC